MTETRRISIGQFPSDKRINDEIEGWEADGWELWSVVHSGERGNVANLYFRRDRIVDAMPPIPVAARSWRDPR